MCARAADLFLNDDAAARSATRRRRRRTTSGSSPPRPACRTCSCAATCGRSHGVLTEMRDGAARPDARPRPVGARHGYGEHGGHALSYYPRGEALGVVLPSNSPGVHSLWVPAIALKMPLVLKPGSAEPWTPFRMIQALIKAGVPARGVLLLPGRSRRRAARSCAGPAAAWSSATSRPSGAGRAIRASRCTVPATARW